MSKFFSNIRKGVKSGVRFVSQFVNLKEIAASEVKPEITKLFVDNEEIFSAYLGLRDQVVFTDKRIIVANSENILGKKTSYFSYPYASIRYFGVETVGALEFNTELIVSVSGSVQQFDFMPEVNIDKLTALLSNKIL